MNHHGALIVSGRKQYCRDSDQNRGHNGYQDGHIVPYGYGDSNHNTFGGSYYHHHDNGHIHGHERAPKEYIITYPRHDNSGHVRDHGLTPEEYRITYPHHGNNGHVRDHGLTPEEYRITYPHRDNVHRRGHERTPEEYSVPYPCQDLVTHRPRHVIQSHSNSYGDGHGYDYGGYGHGDGYGGYPFAIRAQFQHKPLPRPEESGSPVASPAKPTTPAKARVSPDSSPEQWSTESNVVTVSGCTCNCSCVIM